MHATQGRRSPFGPAQKSRTSYLGQFAARFGQNKTLGIWPNLVLLKTCSRELVHPDTHPLCADIYIFVFCEMKARETFVRSSYRPLSFRL